MPPGGTWDLPGGGREPPGGTQAPSGWAPPPPPPAGRARRRGWIIVLAVVAALAVTGGQLAVGGLFRDSGPAVVPAPAGSPAAPAASPPATSAPAGPSLPEEQARFVLNLRAKAVLQHDRISFLATVDGRDQAFYRSQAALYERMATVPFSAFAYTLPHPLRDLATERVRRRYGPAGAFVFPVEVTYRFRGQDASPVLARLFYTFAYRRAGWQIVGQDELRPRLRDDVEIWDAGPVRTVATSRTLVVFHPGDAAVARRLLDVAERGYGQVAASWSARWERKVVILVPRDQGEAQRMVRTRDLSDVAAVTSSVVEAGPSHQVLGNRIITNTSVMRRYATLDLQIVLTHEMTHVATRKVGVGVPLYLVEGFADYTALRSFAVPLRATRPALAAAVGAGRFGGRLPSESQLLGRNAELAYDEGSSFCLWVARSFGEGKLQALYRSFGDLDGDPGRRDEDVRFRRVLGISRAVAEARWAAFVRGAL